MQPAARRLSIPQLSSVEYIVRERKNTQANPETQRSALWLPILVGVFTVLLPLVACILWFKYAWPGLKPLWHLSNKTKPKGRSATSAVTPGEALRDSGPVTAATLSVSGKKFGYGGGLGDLLQSNAYDNAKAADSHVHSRPMIDFSSRRAQT